MGMDGHQFPVAWSLASWIRDLPTPGGRLENSPAVHCPVQVGESTSPEGTAEISQCLWSIPIPILMEVIQPSLRDSMLPGHGPTLERVGYSQFSLREKAKGCPELFGNGRPNRSEYWPQDACGTGFRKRGAPHQIC